MFSDNENLNKNIDKTKKLYIKLESKTVKTEELDSNIVYAPYILSEHVPLLGPAYVKNLNEFADLFK